MKHLILFLLAGTLTILANSTNTAPAKARPSETIHSESRKLKIAVVVFENFSRNSAPATIPNPSLTPSRIPLLGSNPRGQMKLDPGVKIDSYSELARSILENELAQRPEIELLERKRMELIQREIDLNRSRGGKRYLDEGADKRHGADFLVIGEILDVYSERAEFEGYGLSTVTDSIFAQVYVRVVKVASESVVFTADSTGSDGWVTTQFSKSSHSDPPASAIRQAVRDLVRSRAFLDSFVETLQREMTPRLFETGGVKVKFAVKGASVELNGFFVGVAPLTRLLAPGQEHSVRLTKPGFRPWEARVLPEPGLTVAPALDPLPAEKLPTQTNKTNQP